MKKKLKGLTLVELMIALALMGLVAAAALSALSLGTFGFNATKQVLDVTMADADFATRISSTIRTSGVTFTIPERSFRIDNFTAGWNYLGLMHNVDIPESMSRTGQHIRGADALVYIQYMGETEPDSASLPANTLRIHSDTDGWFYMTILGHSYEDTAGIQHNYSLIFEPTDPNNYIAQTISYKFSSTGSGDGTIETVLQSLNAIQIVYQGSASNPATAIAFRSDFIPTSSSTTYTEARVVYGTVVLVMDVSGSMNTYNLTTPMKNAANGFLNEISQNNEHMNGLIVTFGYYADCPKGQSYYNFSIDNPTLDVVNIRQNRAALEDTVNNIRISGDTNLGDGVRVAGVKIREYEIANGGPFIRKAIANSSSPINPIHLVILSDGEMNRATLKINASSTSSPAVTDYYTGNKIYGQTGWSTEFQMSSCTAALGRSYFTKIANDFKAEFDPYVYIVNLNHGMKTDDLNTIKGVFPETETFNASSLAEIDAVFEVINTRITNQMWAFEGPRI